MVRRYLGFSAMEWLILALGVGALFVWRYVFPGNWIRMYITGFALAFLFEASMEPLFTYHQQLKEKHCIGRSDVNFLFPFGWLMTAGLTSLIATRLPSSIPTVVTFIIGALIAGNAMELIFHRLKLWVYNHDAPYIGNWKPLMPRITLLGIPVQIILGYSIVGLMVYGLVHGLYQA